LGEKIPPDARLTLLAGCSGGEVVAGAAGRTVCSCFSVGLKTLLDAIVERRLTSVPAIGRALRAGTNCGSCLPELAAILRGAQA
jgi:assimilatory nitrate reductase catalytic subunit